jgi:hypothetical protein
MDMLGTPAETLLHAILRQALADRVYTPTGTATTKEAQRERQRRAEQAQCGLDEMTEIFQRLEAIRNRDV